MILDQSIRVAVSQSKRRSASAEEELEDVRDVDALRGIPILWP
jgi:hypothetical protein